MKYDVNIDFEYSECGDGCCSYFYEIVYVNGEEICRVDSPPTDFRDCVHRLFAVLNAREACSEDSENNESIKDELRLTYSYVFDRDYDEKDYGEGEYPYGMIQDAIFLNEVLLTDEYYGMDVLNWILDRLGIPYREVYMDFDTEAFDARREFILSESVD